MFFLHSNYGASSKVFTFNKLLIFVAVVAVVAVHFNMCTNSKEKSLYIYKYIYKEVFFYIFMA